MPILEYQIAQPERRRYATPLLLVHGAWHAAWCWQDAMLDLAARGFEAHALSLRGHGTSDRPRSFNLSSLGAYVRDLETAIDSIHPRPIVVAHSMGAYVLQLYLTSGVLFPPPAHAPPTSASPLPGAVLLASPPPGGILPFLVRYTRKHPVTALAALCTADVRRMVATPQLAREYFFRRNTPQELVDRCVGRLDREPLRVALEMMGLVRPAPARNRTHALVIAAEHDALFSLDEQRRLADAYGARLVVVPGAAHDLMLDAGWPAVADAIEQFVASGQERGRAG